MTWKDDVPAGYDEAEYQSPRPNVFIQWKGTNSCGDYYCTCGEQWHIDSYFVYYTRCPACKQAYRVGCHVRLYPLTPEQAAPHEDRIVGPRTRDSLISRTGEPGGR